MEVVHDSLWERCLADAVKMYRLSEPNEKCYSLANATWVLKKKYQEHQEKKNGRQTIMLSKAPDMVNNEQRSIKNICCATTMSGKPCSFKAICGDFCKKHSVKNATLGAKVDVSKIKITD